MFPAGVEVWIEAQQHLAGGASDVPAVARAVCEGITTEGAVIQVRLKPFVCNSLCIFKVAPHHNSLLRDQTRLAMTGDKSLHIYHRTVCMAALQPVWSDSTFAASCCSTFAAQMCIGHVEELPCRQPQ